MLSFVVRVHWGGDVPRPQLQPYVIPKHLAVHCWSERSHHSPETVPGKRGIIYFSLLLKHWAERGQKQTIADTDNEWTGGHTLAPNNKQMRPCWTSKLTHFTYLRFLVQVLMELACFEPLRRLVCGMFLPQCSPQGGVLQPCRSVCSSAEKQCSQALDLFSFSWPFNCHLLPDSQDPMECSIPWCFEHVKFQLFLLTSLALLTSSSKDGKGLHFTQD